MEAAFRKGGLKDIAVKHVVGELKFESAEEYWGFMTEIAAPVVAGLATSRRTDAQKDRGRGTRFGAQDIARRQTVPGMVGLHYLGTQIELRLPGPCRLMRQQSFLGVSR